MDFFSSDWIPIFFTMDIENYIKAKMILSTNNITFRDASIDHQKRLSLNNLFARNIALSDNSSVNNNYILQVKTKDVYMGKKLLSVLSKT